VLLKWLQLALLDADVLSSRCGSGCLPLPMSDADLGEFPPHSNAAPAHSMHFDRAL
jgi:hypothetical protein